MSAPGRHLRALGGGLWIALAGLGAALAVGVIAARSLRHHVSTDDAFVEATMSYVAAQVPGRVAEVRVAEHERVGRGQVLLQLEREEFTLRVERARADLEAARNRLAEAEAEAAAADAERQAAKVELWRAERELSRVRTLREGGASSQQQLDAAQAQRDAVEARVRALALRAKAERVVLGNEAPVQQAEASLHDAMLALSRTEVVAPFDGVVGRKNVEPGSVVAAGQPLLALVSDDEVWIMANFKETQLERMRIGARARVRVDAFPDREWRGHVDSFSPATGAKYALIAPEPAAGNFTKVVQRVPVKIVLDDPKAEGDAERPADRLAAGLSAEVLVAVD